MIGQLFLLSSPFAIFPDAQLLPTSSDAGYCDGVILAAVGLLNRWPTHPCPLAVRHQPILNTRS